MREERIANRFPRQALNEKLSFRSIRKSRNGFVVFILDQKRASGTYKCILCGSLQEYADDQKADSLLMLQTNIC